MRDVSTVAASGQALPGTRVLDRLRGRVRGGSLALDIVTASAVALVLGLIRLGMPSFWVDESFTARAMDTPLRELFDRQYHFLYYLLLKPWTALAGASESMLRLPSVVGMMLSCALLVVIARRLFDRHVALVGGVLLAASPFLVKWSQQARGYTFMLAVGLLATLLLLRAVERGSRWSWAAYGLVFSAVVVWHPVSGVLLVPAHAVLAARRRAHVLPHGLLAAVVIAALAVPWAAVVAMRSTGEGVAMNWLTFPSSETVARGLLDVSGAAGLGLVLALVGLWALRRSGRSELAVWLAVWAFAPFVLALLVSIGRPIYLDRYLMVAAPAFALLAAVALTSLGIRLRVPAVVAVVTATGVGLGLWYTSSSEDGNWRGEDWTRAVATVLERQDEADAIVVAPWSSRAAAEFYGARVTDTSTADSIWVFTWSETGDELPATERRGLGFGEHVLAERIRFGRRVNAELWRR